jgi:regulator of protease activity HflC (stomatin/prohibitin superfamily)
MTVVSTVDRAALRITGIQWVDAAMAGALWLLSGIATVEPGSRAVIVRWGAVDRVVPSGLVLAWPVPIERIIRIPGAELAQSTEMHRFAASAAAPIATAAGLAEQAAAQAPAAVPAGSPAAGQLGRYEVGFPAANGSNGCLTGDLGLVHLTATVVWTVDDPGDFVAAGGDGAGTISQALERAFTASAIAVVARRSIGSVLVVGSPQGDPSAAQSRERLRTELATELNARLAALRLGLIAQRIDLALSLPEAAKPAFAAVLSAGQAAERQVAEARAGAERQRQDAAQARTQRLAQATALASELISHARVSTAFILSLAQERDPERQYLMRERIYRDHVEAVLRHAAQLILVSPQTPLMVWWMQLWQPGGKP